MADSQNYRDKKAFFSKMLTVYGRNAVMEALQDPQLECHALHLADSNRNSSAIERLLTAAKKRGVPVQYHSRKALSHLSKNARQDQGVAADVLCPAYQTLNDYRAKLSDQPQRLLALDGIHNPQNLGMILRSATAGAIDGILLSKKGNAALGPLVIKASAGTAYRAPIIHCDDLAESLGFLKQQGFSVASLEASASADLFTSAPAKHQIYVLGNETDGVSKPVSKLADTPLSIPMRRGVESLNVAVTASLIAFLPPNKQ